MRESAAVQNHGAARITKRLVITHVVDINHTGIDRGGDLPKKVEILSQQVTRLDIEIDTGVR
jgi:hypothetical protein